MKINVVVVSLVSVLLLSTPLIDMTDSLSDSNSPQDFSPLSIQPNRLVEEWRYPMSYYGWGWFGSSPGIADLGPDVNNNGTEPNSDLEIVTGSDEYYDYFWELGGTAPGIWRCLDSGGRLEWAKDSESDETRGSVALVDIDEDDDLEIVGGTTSGETVEVMDHLGNFIWTFPKPPRIGNFYYPGAPAVADLNPSINGLEVVIGNRPLGTVLAFDGDNSDAIDDGISATGIPGSPYTGNEGIDWDILWVFQTGGDVWSTPAIGDIDNDGSLEVVIGSTDRNMYVLNGSDGSLENTFHTSSSIYSSAALANLDDDPYLEIVFGSTDDNIYCIQWDGSVLTTEWTYSTGGAVYSSAAIGDIDADGDLEIVVGSIDGNIYSISPSGSIEWIHSTGGAVYSSPALANTDEVDQYSIEWPMFRNNPNRTGLYGPASLHHLDVYVGSDAGYLFLIDGDTGQGIDRFQVFKGPMGSVHTSPSVADIDGDLKLEIVFYDWGQDSVRKGHTFWCLEDTGGALNTPVAIEAYCYSEGKYISVDIQMNEAPSGFSTPHSFNLTAPTNFTVPSTDPTGHSFINWSTGESNNTILIATNGTYIAYYGLEVHDIAVTNLTLSRNLVNLNWTVQANVTVKNEGHFTETFNLMIYHGDFINEWNIFWAKGDVNGDGYINSVDADLIVASFGLTVPPANPAFDLNDDFIISLHDITVCAFHNGYEIWTFLGIPPPIETQIVSNLPSGNSTTLTFTWNTTGMATGNYTISAYAWILPWEFDVADNTLINGIVQIRWPYDNTGDDYCGIDDIVAVADRFGTEPGGPPNTYGYYYNIKHDINLDDYVGIDDIVTTAEHFGETAP